MNIHDRRSFLMALLAPALVRQRVPYRQWALKGQIVIGEIYEHKTRDLVDRIKRLERDMDRS